MPGLIVKAATATGVQPYYSLLLGGLSVLEDADNRYGVPIESIEVIEAGPGGVSSMEFDIDDPNRLITMAAGTQVVFNNWNENEIVFRGYVDHWSLSPAFGTGRTIHVTCVGVEVWLDWTLVPTRTVPPGGADTNIVALANSLETPLVAAAQIFGGSQGGVRGVGIDLQQPTGGAGVGMVAVPIAGGTTLRQAIETVMRSASFLHADLNLVPVTYLLTVDFYFTLRLWIDLHPTAFTPQQPFDYNELTVTDTTATFQNAEDLAYAVEPGDPPHEIYVIGGTAAGTGYFGDGSGIKGRQIPLTDSSITDAVTAGTRARALLAEFAPMLRGRFVLSDLNPALYNHIHPGSRLTLTDVQVGASGLTRIFEIRKRFTAANRETWTVAFGGAPPSASRLIRKLTRSVAA